MINFLPDTIKTFSNQSQQTVGALIKSIKADKAQVSEIVKSLSTFSAGADYAPSNINPRDLIESETLVDAFRDMQMRFAQYFNTANAINVTTNSMVDVMLSQISNIEKNIEYLESYINNYDFISGKDDLYNYSYIENFNNALKSNENTAKKIPYTDRGGAPFDGNGNGYIDPVVSKFRIGSGINFINPVGLIKSLILDSNYSQYISSISDNANLFNEKQSNVWNVSIKSPTILTSLPKFLSQYIDYDYSYIVGAKTVLEINLIKEIEMDVIRINPNEFNGLQLMQVAIDSANIAETIYSANSNVPNSGYQLKKLLSAPVQMKSTFDITFPLDKVRKIVLVFNQPSYTKSVNKISPDESAARVIQSLLQQSRLDKKNAHNKLQDIVLEYFRKNSSIDEAKKNEYSYSDYYSYKYPIDENHKHNSGYEKFMNQKNNLVNIDQDNNLFSENQLTHTVRNILSQALGQKFNMFNNTMFLDKKAGIGDQSLSGINNSGHLIANDSGGSWRRGPGQFMNDSRMPGSTFMSNLITQNLDSQVNSFEYSFSLKNVQFGRTNKNATNALNMSKASFISSTVAIPGSALGIKAKINLDDNTSSIALPNFDLKQANSYELSISLKPEPTSENDWRPIVPYGSSTIESEILFVDPLSKTATLRFYPIETSLRLYCDQKLVNNNFGINKFNKTITIDNFQPKSTYIVSYSVDDINFSQDYIDLSVLGISDSFVGSSTNRVNGESFNKTFTGNTVKLDNEPFVDQEKLVDASYSHTLGTITTLTNQGYTPVAVRFSDGTYAINLTNYIDGNNQKATFYNTSEILFFQNGKDILFNKEINKSFNVIYNYLDNYLRFRLIIRNNYNNYFSTGSVDNIMLKIKTKNTDINSNKLLSLG